MESNHSTNKIKSHKQFICWIKIYSFNIYFTSALLLTTQWKHWDRRRTCIDEDPSIDHVYFLYWKHLLALRIGLVCKINQTKVLPVQSLRGVRSDGNWRHSEGFEQVVATLIVVRYTTTARRPICWIKVYTIETNVCYSLSRIPWRR